MLPPAGNRLGEIEALIEIHHEVHVITHDLSDGGDGGEIIGETSRPRSSLRPANPPSSHSSIASAATASGAFSHRPLLLWGLTVAHGRSAISSGGSAFWR